MPHWEDWEDFDGFIEHVDFRSLLNRIAISWLRRRAEHEIPDHAKLVWLWVERVQEGDGHSFETVTSPAYE